jgi:hypothetical protein
VHRSDRGCQALNVSGSALVNPDGTPRSTNVIERERARRLHAARLLASRSGGSPGGGMAEQDGSEEGSQDHYSSLDVGIGDEGIKKFAYRLHHNKPTPGKPGMLTQLKDLRLFGNSIGYASRRHPSTFLSLGGGRHPSTSLSGWWPPSLSTFLGGWWPCCRLVSGWWPPSLSTSL